MSVFDRPMPPESHFDQKSNGKKMESYSNYSSLSGCAIACAELAGVCVAVEWYSWRHFEKA